MLLTLYLQRDGKNLGGVVRLQPFSIRCAVGNRSFPTKFGRPRVPCSSEALLPNCCAVEGLAIPKNGGARRRWLVIASALAADAARLRYSYAGPINMRKAGHPDY